MLAQLVTRNLRNFRWWPYFKNEDGTKKGTRRFRRTRYDSTHGYVLISERGGSSCRDFDTGD